jgi:hypothetical protein
VKKNGGILVSVAGMHPEKGNAIVYLVREAFTGRVLVAEQVMVVDTTATKKLSAPVAALDITVLGTITDT